MERQYGGLAGRGSVPKEGLRRGQGGCGGDRCVYTRAVRFTRHPARMRKRTKATSIDIAHRAQLDRAVAQAAKRLADQRQSLGQNPASGRLLLVTVHEWAFRYADLIRSEETKLK